MSTILDYIKKDPSGKPIQPDLLLAKRNGDKIGMIPFASGFNFSHYMNSADEIAFDVVKYIDGKQNPMWDEIIDFRLVYIDDYADKSGNYDPWFEIYVEIDDDDETVKHVTGDHLQEAELGQLMIFDTEINTADDIARDDYKEPTKFYNPDNPKASLLNRIIADKAPHYSIVHVDESLKNIQRSFSFDNTSIYDALQDVAQDIDCLFIFGVHTSGIDRKIHRTISAYDLQDWCQKCGERGNFPLDTCTNCGSTSIVSGYGQDTNIFVSKENLADNVNYSNDDDSVKNCFRVVAGDDLMTATVRNINPNGSNYLYYITSGLRSEMSEELQNKLVEYDKQYKYYQNEYKMDDAGHSIDKKYIDNYNSLVNKYKSLKTDLTTMEYPIVGFDALINDMYDAGDLYSYLKTTLAPGADDVDDTTAYEQASQLTSANLSSVGFTYDPSKISKSTADSAMVTLCGVYVDTSRYRVQVASSTYNAPNWSGKFTVTSFTDKTDTATSGTVNSTFNLDSAEYVKQLVEKTMARKDSQQLGAVALFKKSDSEFKSALKLYSIDNLEMFQSLCTAAKDVLTEQGVASASSPLYVEMYLPYYQKGQYIEEELALRESEVRMLGKLSQSDDDGLNEVLEAEREYIADKLDMEKFLGEDLWYEFCSYRREQEYSNSNYISDDLTNAQLIQKAKELYDKAMRELIKSATLQNSISGTIKDFLLMPEFSSIQDYFQVGNWIHLEVDEVPYKLRIISIKIDYGSLDTIQVEFSNVINALGTLNDVQSILDQAKSMATTYAYTAHKADKGEKANKKLYTFVRDGLDLTSKKIVSQADDQAITYDEHGLLCRRKNDFNDDYNDEQVKIIHNGIYYTSDKWKTVQTGLGHFIYTDPDTNEEVDAYGVIAQTIVGKIFLGNEVGIYNNSGTLKVDDNGIVITSEYQGSDNKNLLTIQKKLPDGTTKPLLYLNTNGDLVIGLDNENVNIDDNGTTFSQYIKSTQDGIKTYVGQTYVTQDYAGQMYKNINTSITQTKDSIIQQVSSTYSTIDETITDVTVEYIQTDSATETPVETSTNKWSTAHPQWKDGMYIWTRTVTTCADGNVTTSDPVCISGRNGVDGVAGKTGTGIKSTDITYGISSSESVKPTTWSSQVPTLTKGNYLWTKTVWTYTDNTTETGYQVTYISKDGNNGSDGQPGKDGTGISSTQIYYCGSSSGTTAPTSGWSTQVPTVQAGKFLWTKTIWHYTDNTSEIGYSVGKIGDTGVGIKSIVPQYYLSSSSTAQSDGSWSTDEPEWKTGYYIWTRSYITWDNGTTSTTTPVLSKAINGANEVAYKASLKVTDENIEAKVEKYVNDNLKDEIAQIKVNSDAIQQKVSKGDIASTINQTAQGVKISASKIDLSGYATFSSLSTSGSTEINGSNITTGTIKANRIKLGGKMSVYKTLSSSTIGGYIGYATGLTAGGVTTDGIAMINYEDNGNYVIATESGVRLTSENDGVYVQVPNYDHFMVNGTSYLKTVYPVGAIYISTSSTSPGLLFGGSWTQIKGRFLVSTGYNAKNTATFFGSLSANTINIPAGELGGEVKHTLNINEIPKHQHDIAKGSSSTGGQTNFPTWHARFNVRSSYGSYSDQTTTAPNAMGTRYVGGGTSHNNMPPYLSVYMWKRIS